MPVRSVVGARKEYLVTMGQSAGDGVDIPNLDTLFLAAPFRFEGLAVQCTGYVTRDPHRNAVVNDYVDVKVPILV